MGFPTSADLFTMDYFYNGQPFCNDNVSELDLGTMDYFYDGQPFLFPSSVVSYNIKSIGGVLLTNIKSLNGVLIANIKSVGGVSKL